MRIRTVKPEFWTDEGLSSISDFARLLAIALLNYSDDDGYFLSNQILIRGACFPFLDDYKKIQIALQELSKIGFLELGKLDDGRDVARIPNFRKHQRIDKPQKSKLKEKSQFQEYSENNPRTFQEYSENNPRTFQEHSKSILGGNGMEQGMEQGMEKEQGRGKKQKQIIPPTLEEIKEFCKEKGYKFFDCGKYFELRDNCGWENAKGRKIVNWKNDINTAQSFGNFQRPKTAEELDKEHWDNVDAFCDELSRQVY